MSEQFETKMCPVCHAAPLDSDTLWVHEKVHAASRDDGKHERCQIPFALMPVIADLVREAITASLSAAEARVKELEKACIGQNEEVCQILGKALSYPWFKDDPANFPNATEADGVCVGDHVAESIAEEAAKALQAKDAEIERMREERIIDPRFVPTEIVKRYQTDCVFKHLADAMYAMVRKKDCTLDDFRDALCVARNLKHENEQLDREAAAAARRGA